MKPFYATSEFWLNLALAAVGAVASMQGLPGSVTQIAGLLAMALSAILHTTSRTVLKHQDSAEQAAASLAVIVPDAGKMSDPAVGLANFAKTVVLCVLASSLMSCASFKTLMAPTTPAECATTQAISGDVRNALGGGTLGTSIAALEDQAGASQKVLTATSVGLGAGALLAGGWHWYVDAVQCPETGAMLTPAHSAMEPVTP